MNATEQTLREKLAAAHHIIHFSGWDDLLATHISLRIPDSDHILVTPMNVPFEEVCASKLIKCDFDGNIVEANGERLMPQAINIHGAIYHNPKIMAAVHTHSLYGLTVSVLKEGFLYLTQDSARFYQDIAYHDFDGLALENEGAAIAASLKDKRVMILRNHGLLTSGQSIEEAVYLIHYLEKSCQQQVQILSTGKDYVPLSEQACVHTKRQFDSILTPELEFEALTRRIEGKSRVDFRA